MSYNYFGYFESDDCVSYYNNYKSSESLKIYLNEKMTPR